MERLTSEGNGYYKAKSTCKISNPRLPAAVALGSRAVRGGLRCESRPINHNCRLFFSGSKKDVYFEK